MKRLEFFKATGAVGLFIAFPIAAAFQEPAKIPERLSGYPKDFNAYLKIGPDGRVGCFVGKVEMGQGNMTALAMLAAEELEVPLERVDMLMGDTDLCPWDGGTWGSLSVWQFGPVLRGAAAEARAVLVQLAAERLGVPADRLQVKDGVVSVVGDSAKRVPYGELVEGRRIERHLLDVKVKPVAQFSLVGKDAPRKDGRLKVTGAAKYAADILPPGILHACLLRPPAHGAKLLSADVSEAEKVAGVKVIQQGDLVAVLHPRPDMARQALNRVKAAYQPSPSTLDDRTIFEHLLKSAPAPKELVAKGSIPVGETNSKHRLEATYLNSYVAHAPMEPHSAVAQWEKGKLTLWASTQAWTRPAASPSGSTTSTAPGMQRRRRSTKYPTRRSCPPVAGWGVTPPVSIPSASGPGGPPPPTPMSTPGNPTWMPWPPRQAWIPWRSGFGISRIPGWWRCCMRRRKPSGGARRLAPAAGGSAWPAPTTGTPWWRPWPKWPWIRPPGT